MNPKVDEFIGDESRWQEEFRKLRQILLDCRLSEELKWGKPCYMAKGKNILIMHGFKEYCALLFVKGSLLKDSKGILVAQTENVQAGRQVRFTKVQEIVKLEKTLKEYILEAIEVEASGLEVQFKKASEYVVPEELRKRLDGDSALRTAFQSLTPGRQKGYIFHISQAKQSTTRESRIEKCVPRILDGLGLDD
ncbi:MAG: YdeI/OmpD-associated family protein [Rectinemataceae bacterium]